MGQLCIYPKEVAWLLKISERQAQRILKEIRKELNKKKNQVVTVKEFSVYKGIKEADVQQELDSM